MDNFPTVNLPTFLKNQNFFLFHFLHQAGSSIFYFDALNNCPQNCNVETTSGLKKITIPTFLNNLQSVARFTPKLCSNIFVLSCFPSYIHNFHVIVSQRCLAQVGKAKLSGRPRAWYYRCCVSSLSSASVLFTFIFQSLFRDSNIFPGLLVLTFPRTLKILLLYLWATLLLLRSLLPV